MIYIYYRHDKAKQSKTKHFKSCVLILDTAKTEVVDSQRSPFFIDQNHTEIAPVHFT